MFARTEETDLPKKKLEVIEVKAWEAGRHEGNGKIVVVFRYSDREPVAWGCDPAIAEEIGKGLLALAAEARNWQH